MRTLSPSHPLIAIAGLGSISALGVGIQAAHVAYHQGRTRLAVRSFGGTSVAVGALPTEAEVVLQTFCEQYPRYAELDRSTQLGLVAADQAVRIAEWSEQGTLGVVMGSSRGATELLERYHTDFLGAASHRVPALTSPNTTLGNLSSWVAQHVGATGPATEMSSTCSTSIYAIGTAAAWLRAGMAPRFLAGGTEAPLTGFTVAQMRALRVLSKQPTADTPCRPCALEAGRTNTMVLGEGACVLALEPYDRARSQGLSPLGLLVGMGFAVEPIQTHTGLSEEGLALRLSMMRALEDAGLDRVDAVVTHTPGTALGDRAELSAIRDVFGSRRPLLTSNKWILGHTLGASGALGLEYALHLLHHQHWAEYPYAVSFHNEPRVLKTVMVNSVGFGGNAGSIIVAREQFLDEVPALGQPAW
jgi:3-oxoacyl-(acyl-carrier-protein) synthase